MTADYGAIRMERFAPSFREACEIVRLPLAAPAPGQIMVRNQWCGVNAIFDTQIARNAVDYVKIKPPTLTGVEAMGVVEAVGDGVSGFTVGDWAATVRFPGGYREAHVGPESLFIRTPGADPAWLALASTGVSAYLALEHVGQVKDGETVAVSAAAGGLGHIIVQLAKLRGCRVVAICGGERKSALARSLGADRVIDHRTESVAQVLATEFPNAIDVAVDTVSGGIFDALVDNLAVHGRLVAGGAAQDLDGVPEIVTGPRITQKLYYKGASVRGFMNGLLTEHWAPARARLFELYAAGRLKVIFDDQPFRGLTQVNDAVEHLLSGRSMGKVVVNLQS